MNLLAFECANFSCSVAVFNGDGPTPKLLAFEKNESSQGQGAKLVPLIQTVLKQANLSFQQLNAIAVTTGAGSFTGVRIGLAAAHGFKLATGVPTIGINSFEVAAYAASQCNPNDYPILVVLESRRQDRYCQLFDAGGSPLKSAAALLPDELADYAPSKVLIAGDGYQDFLPPEFKSLPTVTPVFTAQEVGIYAHHIIAQNKMAHYPLVPFYLRMPDISCSQKK